MSEGMERLLRGISIAVMLAVFIAALMAMWVGEWSHAIVFLICFVAIWFLASNLFD